MLCALAASQDTQRDRRGKKQRWKCLCFLEVSQERHKQLQNVRPIINTTGLGRSSLTREKLRFRLALSKASNNRASN